MPRDKHEKIEYRNGMQDDRLDRLEKKIDDAQECLTEIRENHFVHLSAAVTKVTNDVEWLSRFFWIVATASVGGLIAGVMNLVIP